MRREKLRKIKKFHKRYRYVEPIITSLLWLLFGIFLTSLYEDIQGIGFLKCLRSVNLWISVILFICILIYYMYLSTYGKEIKEDDLLPSLKQGIRKDIREANKETAERRLEIYITASEIINNR